ncbi:TetR/AcrR family transcriptional regulator [Gordonia sp. (in: high G+C Gram-positive bacteria)]|uniref:TetR/AcrR family transcriptional regulator n=1 Tax=unclassified Gordonia (in: high G+C Gram-positive bacteria) TaxID=2657482 RepID=UPI00261099C2|nr:TetR family transcriptional regulator [Gordonia sp. (in: high G+C Gram-positive bacteria)]
MNTPARTGRRSGDSTARDDILAAARELFASGGFGATTLRAVAARAGVDVALIPYYFSNKRGLFIAAMALPVNPEERLAAAIAGPRDELGRRLTTAFVSAWTDPGTSPALQGALRSAISGEPGAYPLGEFASAAMLPLLAEQAQISDEASRVLVSTLFGIVTMRYLVQAPAFTEPSPADLIETFAPRVQAVIDAD